jgi:hypothetical protein
VEAYGRNVESFLRGPGFWRGPKRYLPPGNPMSLYWEYLAWMRDRTEEPASWSVFFRIFKKLWGVKLKFRKRKGQHAECDMCVGLKRDIKLARTFPERHGLMQRYMSHIFSQWRDRMVWWSLCTLSVQWSSQSMAIGARMQAISVGASCIAVIADGVDQAKFRVPRVTTDGALHPFPERSNASGHHVMFLRLACIVWVWGRVA